MVSSPDNIRKSSLPTYKELFGQNAGTFHVKGSSETTPSSFSIEIEGLRNGHEGPRERRRASYNLAVRPRYSWV